MNDVLLRGAQSAVAPPVRMIALHRMAQGGKWRTQAMRGYNRPSLYWITSGQGRFTVQGVTRGYGPNNLILLPPGTMHGFEVMGRISGWLVHLPHDPEGLPSDPLHLRLRDAVHQREMSRHLDDISREIEAGAPGRDAALAHRAALLQLWLARQAGARWTTDAPSPARAAERLAAAYTALVERDFRRGRTITEYAADLGVTATHLSRSCRAACGHTASQLLQQRVHFEARRLLHETSAPVKEIAGLLGFRSAAYFTRAFQQHTGQTPTTFRRQP